MGLAIDFIDDGVDLEGVVALNVLEAIHVGGGLRRIRNGGAVEVLGRLYGQRYDGGGDFRRSLVMDVDAVSRPIDRRIGWMLIRPRRVPVSGMHDTKNGVGAHEVPGVDRFAIL